MKKIMKIDITNPKTEYYLHYSGSVYYTEIIYTQSKLINSQLIRPQLSMTDDFKGVTIAPLTTFTYASWSVEMEALLRAKGLWKCTQVLAQDL